jgi:hypothetical protein
MHGPVLEPPGALKRRPQIGVNAAAKFQLSSLPHYPAKRRHDDSKLPHG